MVEILDIGDLRKEFHKLPHRSLDEQMRFIREYTSDQHGVNLPEGMLKLSIEKFGSIYDSPILLIRLINAILRNKVKEGVTDIELRNPEGLYFLASGLEGKVNLRVIGDVGNSFAAQCNIGGTLSVYGTAENQLANHGYKGRIVVHNIVTELAGQTNQGVDILALKGATERTCAQMRGGTIVAFGLGYNSGLYLNGGIILNLSPESPGEEIGSGMTGGIIYAPENATVGMDAIKKPLEAEDYENIAKTLRKHSELKIQGLGVFSRERSTLFIENYSGKTYHFADFVKVVPK